MSDASASALSGAVYRRAGGGVLRAVVARVVFDRFGVRDVRRAEEADPLLPPLGGRTPPFCATALGADIDKAAAKASRTVSGGKRRAKIDCVRVTMSDVATGVPGTLVKAAGRAGPAGRVGCRDCTVIRRTNCQ
jgi:hypothetical protein